MASNRLLIRSANGTNTPPLPTATDDTNAQLHLEKQNINNVVDNPVSRNKHLKLRNISSRQRAKSFEQFRGRQKELHPLIFTSAKLNIKLVLVFHMTYFRFQFKSRLCILVFRPRILEFTNYMFLNLRPKNPVCILSSRAEYLN